MEEDEEIDDIFEEETSKNMENGILPQLKPTKKGNGTVKLTEIKNEINDLDIKIEQLSEEYDIPCKKEIDYFETPYIRQKSDTFLQVPISKETITMEHTCLVCRKRFSSVHKRNVHFNRHFEVPTTNKRKTDLNSYFGKHIFVCSFCGKWSVTKMDILTHCLLHRVKTATPKPTIGLKLSTKRNADIENVYFLQNKSKPTCTRNDIGTGKFKRKSQKRLPINRSQFLRSFTRGNSQKLSNIKRKQEISYHKSEMCSNSIIKNDERFKKMNLRDKKKLKCNYCEKEFKHRTFLLNHKLSHTGERLYTCKLCPKAYRYPQDLKRHILYHTGEKPFGCKICSKHFTQKQHLKRHLYCHYDEKPFKCEQCSKGFTSKSALGTHSRDHTGETPYECGICAKRFTRKTNLTYHLLSHTNQKPFECANCCMKFKQKQDLKRHLFKHTGEKNFNCNICAKTFTRKQSLKDHLRTHTGEKPFRCELCPKQFAVSQNLHAHVRKHTKI